MFRRKQKLDPLGETAAELYRRVVERARREDWYLAGGVADTVDGRFDMVALMLSLLLVRLEQVKDEREAAARRLGVRLTELFVEDMDSSLRQIGVGDMMIGKRVGRTVAALGGRLGAYREAMTGSASLRDALARNLYRGAENVSAGALGWSETRAGEEWSRLETLSDDALTGGAA